MSEPETNIVSSHQLKAARVLAGLSQAALARAAGFHASSAKYWETKGDEMPTTTPSTLQRIEAALQRHGVAVFLSPSPGARTIQAAD
jgi:transcriptional regulator with XRE-family HTH domain